MKKQPKKQNMILHRTGSILLSFVLTLSVFMPNVLSVWAEENTSSEDEAIYETQETGLQDEQGEISAEEEHVHEEAEEHVHAEEADHVHEEAEEAVPETAEPAEETDAAEAEEPAVQEETAYPAFSQSVTLDDVIISLSADAGAFPEGAYLQAEKITVPEAEEAVSEKREAGRNVAVSYTFDIKVLDAAGNELQPAAGQNVAVSFRLAEVADSNLDTDVWHVSEEAGVLSAEELPAVQDGDTVTAETAGFSLFTVEFTYQDLRYVLTGEKSVPLAEVLNAVGLSGTPEAVLVSNESLFSVSQENGEWILTSHQAFATEEWLKAEINGIVYEIAVADAETEMNWAAVQAWIDAAGDGDRLVLEADLTADAGDSALVIPAGRTVTIDLNGHSLVAAKDNDGGHTGAFTVNGTLNLQNSGSAKAVVTGSVKNNGTMKAENISFSGTYIASSDRLLDNRGTLEMNNCVITENTTRVFGGLLYSSGGRLVMNACEITNNTNQSYLALMYMTDSTQASMTDCVISGNQSPENTGRSPAINIMDGGVLTMKNVTVTGNTAYANPGIFVADDGVLKVEGRIIIHDNIQTYQGTTTTYGEDLFLDTEAKLQFSGPLDAESMIGIESYNVPSAREPNDIVLTQGLRGNGELSNFVFTDSRAAIGLTAEGEVVVGVPVTVHFLANGGSGEMPDVKCPKNSYIKMPENGFTAPEGRDFLTWEYLGSKYQPGALVQITQEKDVTAQWGENRWQFIQSEINALHEAGGGTIRLTYDITADANDAALLIPDYAKITLDLNGHKIDRHRENPEENGSVIINNGTLNIVDSAGGGTITGGMTTGNGGGILSNYSLTISGGTVTGNYAQNNGGGVYCSTRSTATTMDGGTISSNEAGNEGGGIYCEPKKLVIFYSGEVTDNKAGVNAGGIRFCESALLVASGKCVVTGNTVNGSDSNVYLHSGAYLGITTRFDTEASLIGFTTEDKPTAGNPINLTRLNRGRGTTANFFSDNKEYGVFQELEEEARLVVPVTVTFDKGHENASGEMAAVTAGNGTAYTLPDNGFDLVGGSFIGWYAGDDRETIHKKGEKLTFDQDTVLTAAWDTSPWKELQSRIDHASEGETIVLDKPVTAAAGDSALHVPAGKNITIDLNGFTINRNLSEPVLHGYVFNVEGKLTIMDSGAAQTGTITGGNDVSTGAQADSAGGILINRGELVLKSGTICGNRSFRGSGIHNHFGTLIMEGGTIRDNIAENLGGGIDAINGRTYIRGGSIINNQAGQSGGGIVVSPSDTYFSGSPVIKDNKAKPGNDNVYASITSALNIEGPLTEGAEIHVFHAKNDKIDDPVTITRGFPGNASMDVFVSDEGYFKGYDENGELVFGRTIANVTFAYADGKTESTTWADHSYIPVPEGDYQPIEGQTYLGWKDVNSEGEKMYQSGDLAYVSGATRISETWTNPWVELQKQIDALQSQEEGTIKLEYDVTATPTDVSLHVPAGLKLTLDLNGHKIDRKRVTVENNGSVIVNDGILTIIDSAGGGVITGGKTTGNGGGILNNSNIHFDGGTITGNYARGNGGGVYSVGAMSMEGGVLSNNEAGQKGGGVFVNQALTLYDAKINDNKAGNNGGGVWFEKKGLVVANGKVNITGNTVADKDNNVYLQDGMAVSVASRYDRESLIGVTTEVKPTAGTAVNVTKTNKGRSTAAGFSSDDPAYGLFQELEDEVKLVVPITISFEKGNDSATGEMAAVTAGSGVAYTLPASGFDLVGGAFAGWYVNDDRETIHKQGEKLSFDGDTVLTAAWDESPWKELQSRIDHASDGDVIVLDKTVTAAADDVALRVPEGKNVTIDLNGNTINRNLSEPVTAGYVISVDGRLTVKDSAGGGMITGGNDSGTGSLYNTGGGIHVEGELVLQSGIISGNHASRGGGIMSHFGTVIIEGGTIENNSADSLGGGIDAINGKTYIRGGSIISNTSNNYGGGLIVSPHDTYFSGSPVIRDNTAKNGTDNIYASVSSVLNIEGPLTEGAELYVFHAMNDKVEEPVTITSGLPDNGTLDAFESDQGYYKGYDANGELVFGRYPVTVRYLSGAHSDDEDITMVRAKDSFEVLPECGFTPEDGYTFTGWEIGTEICQPGKKIKISEDTDITAVWSSPWKELQAQINAAGYGDTIVLKEDVTAAASDTALVVSEDKMIRIDLNGHKIDRNRENPETNGSVLVNNGILYIMDSAGGGMITGGSTTGNGGGILNTASLTLNSGVIVGNHAEGNGGGISNTGRVNMYTDARIENNSAGQSGGGVFNDISDAANLHNIVMSGGTITENTAGVSGGGVYGNGFYHISGNSNIVANTVGGRDSNLFISASEGEAKYEHLFGSLSENAHVGITSEIAPTVGSPVTVVQRMADEFSIKGLYSDDPAYIVIQKDKDKAQLAVGVTVTFDKGDPLAEGMMDPVKVPAGEDYPVPDCSFVLEDTSFAGWMIDDDPDQLAAPGDSLKPEKDIRLTALWGSPWKDLQDKINNAKNGDVIVLDDDVTAMPADVPLNIPEGRNITIDLNGHTLDRHLSEKKENGSVMIVNGTLMVTDSAGGGRITGANNDSGDSHLAGAVNVTGGTFILKGGSITGNWSFYAGGVRPADGGTFIMEGGSIENNEAWGAGAVIVDRNTVVDIRGGTIQNNRSEELGAVSVSTSGTFNISGNPVITDNISRGKTYNVDIGDALINVTGELDESARIGVLGIKDDVFTSGLPGRGVIENFVSDSERAIGYTQEGEAVFGPAVTVSFDANGGTGTMDSVRVAKDSYYILPKNTFTPPANMTFDHWGKGSDGYPAGVMIKIEKDTAFLALWKEDPKANLTVHWSSGDGTDLAEPLVFACEKEDTFGEVISIRKDDIAAQFKKDGYTAAAGNNEYGMFLPEPVNTYGSMIQAEAEQISMEAKLGGDREIYYVMIKEQTDVTISVDPVSCGTDMAETGPSARTDSASGSTLTGAVWIGSESDHAPVTSGTLVGDQTAYMDIVLEPKPGIAYSQNLTAAVSGGTEVGHVINEDGTVRITVSVPVEHVPGEAQKENESEATCTEAGGYEKNVYCTQEACGHKLLESEFVETDPATGHEWGEPVYHLSADKQYLIAERECAHHTTLECTEIEQAAVTAAVVTKQPTCEENGETTYTSAPFVNPAFKIQTITLADVEKTGHDWDEPAYTWADDFSTVTAQRICKNDESHIETETAVTEIVDETKAGCTEDGERTYLAVFKNKAFEQQMKTEVIPAVGHDWAEATYTWAEDSSTVTAQRICQNDPAHIESETVSTSVSEKPAECEKEGERTYTAAFTNPAFTAQKKTEVIPATGHDWADATYTWSYDNSTVTAARICRNDSSHSESEKVETTKEVTRPATCEEKGETTYTAVFTNEAFATQTRTEADIDAIGHEWDEGKVTKEATCTEDGVLTYTCKHDPSHTKEEAIPAAGHEPAEAVKENVVAATCTEAGSYDEVIYCRHCHEELSRDHHTEPALGHVWGEWTVVREATEEADGLEERVCERCGEKEERAIPHKDHVHEMTHVDEVPATCTETGLEAHYKCEKCGRYYLDAEGLAEVSYEDLIIEAKGHTVQRSEEDRTPATCTSAGHYYIVVTCTECGEVISRTPVSQPRLGHDWAEPTYTWADDLSTVTAERVCRRDPDHKESETVPISTGITKEPTCTEPGEKTYTAEFTNEAFATQTRTEVISATGHDWDTPVYTWADDLSSVTAEKTCKNDPEHVVRETVSTTSSATLLPTCTEKGETTYTAEFQDVSFAMQTKTVADADPLGHDYGDPVYIWSADNRTVTARMTCDRCGDTVEETAVTSQAVAKKPTCTEKGSTEYTAEFTNEAFETQTRTLDDIDAIGHSWDEGTVTVKPTCEEAGVMTYTCLHDAEHTYTEAIDALGHSPAKPVIENMKAATCTEEGGYDEVVICDRCGKELSRDHHTDPALGHVWGEWTVITEATEEAEGLEQRVCERCGETEERPIPKKDHVHKMVHVDEKPATCTEEGMAEHYECTECHRYFLDEEGTREVNPEDLSIDLIPHQTARRNENRVEPTCTLPGHYDVVVYCEICGEVISRTPVTIPATGHAWGEPTYTWSADGSTVTAESICEHNSSHVQRETAEAAAEVTKEPTCTEPGETTYTAEFKNDLFETQTRTEEIPAKGHDWDTPVYEWAEDSSTVTAKKTCLNDPSETVAETVNTTSKVTREPTCTGKGEAVYTAEFTDPSFRTQTRTVLIDETGHDWNEPTYTWAQDSSTVTAKRICKNDDSHIETETVTTTISETVPTCEQDGERIYTAVFTDSGFTTQTKTEVIPATGHDWAEPTYTWNYDNTRVTAERICRSDPSHKESETAETTAKVTKPATCEEKGETTYTAEFTNEAFATQTKTEADIDAIGHEWDEGKVTKQATCTEDGVLTYTCRHDPSHTKEEAIPATGHEPAEAVKENVVEATCTEAGSYDEVIYCQHCHEELSRDHHTEPALGHAWGEWTVVREATEEADGLEERVCERCGEKEERAIPHKDHVHEMVHADEVPATCTETGLKEHYKCEKCGRYYLDEAGTQEVEYEDLILPVEPHQTARRTENRVRPTCTAAGHYDIVVYCEICGEVISRTVVSQPRLGHDWAEPTYTWADDNSTVTAERICRRDPDHKESETAAIRSEVTKEPTCTEPGEKTYTAEFTNEAFETQTRTEEIPAKGHDWADPVYEWSDDNSTVTATKVCLNDPSETVTETAEAVSEVTKEATCTEKGETTYTAVFTAEDFAAQTKTVADIDALGHDWGEWVIVREPTADAEGLEERTCQRCGETETRTIPKPTAIVYRVVEGDNSSWTRGSTDPLTFRWRRNIDDETTYGHFTAIAVDGRTVDPSAYTAEAGSVIIRLSPAYLQSLSTGQHVLSAVFNDGSSEDAHFTIIDPKKDDTKPDDRAPNTGDHTGMHMLYFAMTLLLSLLAAAAAMRRRFER